MDSTQSGKVILQKAPIVVQESRAQRLQRQQARFRDRGGIFVPSNRNTLVDILLGRKASSPKPRARSASLSPKKSGAKKQRAGEHDDNGALKALRTSPRKAAQRRAEDEGGVAGPSKLPAEENVPKMPKTSRKPVKKSTTTITTTTTAASSKKGKGKTRSDDTEEPVPKRRGRPPKAQPTDVDEDEPKEGIPAESDLQVKAKPKRSTKPPPKRTTTKTKPTQTPNTVEARPEDDPAPEITTKAKAKRGTKTAPKRTSKTIASIPEPEVDGADSAIAPSNALDPGTELVPDAPSKQHSTKFKTADLGRSGDRHEDDPVASKPSKRSQVDDNDLLPSQAQEKTSRADKVTSNDKRKGKPRPPPVDDDEAPKKVNNGKGKLRQTLGDDDEHSTVQDAESTQPPKKRARANPDKEREVQKAKRSKVAATEVEPSSRRGKPKTIAHPRTANALEGKSSAAEEKDADEAMAEVILSPSSKKRIREPDKDGASRAKRARVSGDGYEDKDKDKAARTLVDDQEADKDQRKAQKIHPAEPSCAKAVAVAKTSDTSKSSSKPKGGPKPNLVLLRAKLRPRKSVMQRIKEPLPEMEDDEPDPIDFLC